MITCFLIVLCFGGFSLQAKAVTPEDFREFTSFDSIYEALPEELTKEDVLSFLNEDTFDHGHQIKILWNTIKLGIKENLTFFGGLMFMILCGALFEGLKKSFSLEIGPSFDFLFLLIAALFSFQKIMECADVAKIALESINGFILATLPVSTLLLSMAGSIHSAALQSTCLSFAISVFSTLTSSLYPILRAMICFSFLEGAGETSADSLLRFFRKSVKTICVFSFSTVSFLISSKNALAVAADTMSMRSIRFAAGSFIPVVGSLVGESSKTLAACFQTVKTECGTVCLYVLFFVLIRPLLLILLRKMLFSFSASIAELLQVSVCARFFRSVSGILDLIQALVISQGCYVVFIISLFLKTEGNL